MPTIRQLLPHICIACLLLTSTAFGRPQEQQPPASDATSEKPAATDAAATAESAAKAETPEAPAEQDEEAVPEGHSIHGEVFNDGPRQAAWLIEGCGQVDFPVTTDNDEARQFFLQGVAQLHGFWYFESERSFRQAAKLDPECGMAYWGMAMSNRSNKERAQGFISEALKRKDKVTRRERLYMEAFEKYINAKDSSSDEKQKRAEKYITDLDNLIQEFPDDNEAKAFLCEFFWSARRAGIKAYSYTMIDAMIADVLEAEPLHPIHHYRIHLWDTKKAENALQSAALCGPSAPSIAHMWHMPGHIYSRLKRYHDAVYQQEASARVDHAHMMQYWVLPDQIHNFAHNNEWCIRNLISIGRVNDALDLARNMLSMPRHPKYNHKDKFGSFKYGRQRLLQVLKTYELHAELLVLANTQWLQPVGDDDLDLELERAVGSALVMVGRVEEATSKRDALQERLTEKQAAQKEAGDKAEADAKQEEKDTKAIASARKDAESKFRSAIRSLEQAIAEIDGRIAATRGDYETALEQLKKAGGVPVEYQVSLMSAAGQHDTAVSRIADHVRTNKNEVLPLAAQVLALWNADKKEEARSAFEELRQISATIDLNVPAFAQLKPIAAAMELPEDWRQPLVVADDLSTRPDLDALGPFRWQPMSAPDWTLADIENNPLSLSQYRGKPVILIFYLGFGCLHCAEQLREFEPKIAEFRKAGYEVVAVSTDKQEHLKRAWDDLDTPFSFPLVSDSELNVFRQYRCYDDFESQPLHGTFVIDRQGRVRWQDISYEPFMDADFVLEEANRLLSLDGAVTSEEPIQTAQQ